MYEYRFRDVANLKNNRVYIRTAMHFGTRLNLKPFKPLQYDIHLSTIEVHFPTDPFEKRCCNGQCTKDAFLSVKMDPNRRQAQR
jgi:hypothetical protein